jgi:hypothetical protein
MGIGRKIMTSIAIWIAMLIGKRVIRRVGKRR